MKKHNETNFETEYIILESFNSVELVKKVNEYIKMGWEPIGGVSLGVYENDEAYDNCIYAQAMYKRNQSLKQ